MIDYTKITLKGLLGGVSHVTNPALHSHTTKNSNRASPRKNLSTSSDLYQLEITNKIKREKKSSLFYGIDHNAEDTNALNIYQTF